MSHFAKVEDGIVTSVIVAEQNYVDTQEGTWVQTSYNTYGGIHRLSGTPLRKNYAGIGYIYDSVKDAFYVPKPYTSWTLNDDSCLWLPPIVRPDDADGRLPEDDKAYFWDEDVYQANNSLGWVEV